MELRELLRPLMTGVECAVVKHQLINWRCSHLEDDVRAAMANVGQFSIEELTHVFGVHSDYWNEHSARLLQKVNERLVFRVRGEAFVGVVSSVLSFALPLVRQYRIEVLGWAPERRGTVVSEMLRLLPSVRAWADGNDDDDNDDDDARRGALCVSLGEVRSACAELRALLEQLKLGGWVRKPRVGTSLVWRFEAKILATLMRPQ